MWIEPVSVLVLRPIDTVLGYRLGPCNGQIAVRSSVRSEKVPDYEQCRPDVEALEARVWLRLKLEAVQASNPSLTS
jgi:hypothetical protein